MGCIILQETSFPDKLLDGLQSNDTKGGDFIGLCTRFLPGSLRKGMVWSVSAIRFGQMAKSCSARSEGDPLPRRLPSEPRTRVNPQCVLLLCPFADAGLWADLGRGIREDLHGLLVGDPAIRWRTDAGRQ